MLSTLPAAAATYYWNRNAVLTSSSNIYFNQAYNWTANADGTGAAIPSISDDDFTANTLDANWTILDADNNATPATNVDLITNADQLTLTSRGADMLGATNEFANIWRSDITGNLDVTVKVVSMAGGDATAGKAGLMIADDFTNLASGGYALIAWLRNGHVEFRSDLSGNVGELETVTDNGLVVAGPVWLRLVKNPASNQAISAYYRNSLSSAWTQVGTARVSQSTANSSKVGIFACAKSASSTITDVFDDFQGGTTISAASHALSFNGTGANADANATLTADVTAASVDFTGYTGTMNFGSYNLTLNTGNATFVAGQTLTPGTGTLTFSAGSGTQTLTPQSGTTHPNIVHSGAGTLALATNALTCLSFSQTAGILNFNSLNISTTSLGNFSITNGTTTSMSGLAGRTITVDGTTSLSGQPGNLLNLNPASGWTIASTGGLTADYATITNSTASVSAGLATSSTNGGTNSGWTFSTTAFYWNRNDVITTSTEFNKAYNWTTNANATGIHPTSGTDDDFTADALGGSWTSRDADAQGTPATTMSLTAAADQLTLTDRGADISGATNLYVNIWRSDITGSFDVSVKVVSMAGGDGTAGKAGLMVANDFTNLASGGYCAVAWLRNGHVEFRYDISGNVGELETVIDNGSVIAGPVWLRLVKNGTAFSAFYRNSLSNAWTQVGTAQTPQSTAADSKVSIFSCAKSNTVTITNVFDDFQGGTNMSGTTNDLSFNGTGANADANATLGANFTAGSINFNGYTGAFDFGSYILTIGTGNATFVSGQTVTGGTGTLAFSGGSAQMFIPQSGATYPTVSKSGAGTLTVATNGLTAGAFSLSAGGWNWGASTLTHAVTSLTTSGGTMTFGTNTVQVTSGNANMSGLATLTANSGTLEFTAATGTQVLTPKSAQTHPNILLASAGTVQLATNNLTCLSYSQSAGTLDFNSRNITTTGNFTVTNGSSSTFTNLGGRTLTVAGAASLTGQSNNYLGLYPATGWTIASTGALTAQYANIANSAASVSAGSASNSLNNGGNTNWDFGSGTASWLYNMQINFNTTSTGANVASNITNFPMLIRLDSTNFVFEQAVQDGRDIRFEDPDGSSLSYEIERWDNSARRAEIWVKVPQVDGNSDKDYIVMRWGNSAVSAQTSGSAVFATANNYAGVWHLNEDGNTTASGYPDRTSNAYHGTGTAMTAATDVDAVGGLGQQFNGSTQYVNISASAGSTANHTISFWAKADLLDDQIPVDKEAAATAGWTFKFRADGSLRYRTGSDAGFTDITAPVGTYSPGNWIHVAATFNDAADDAILYINGVNTASNLSDTRLVNDATVALRIGKPASVWTSEDFKGIVDEVEISNTDRSADYIKLTYETQKKNTPTVVYQNSALSLWAYSNKIYINTTRTGANITSDLTNFPLLVRLNNGNFNFSQAKTNGEDIRFADSTGALLSYEIERWDATNKKAEIWVLIPTVAGNNNAQWFKMYWGKASATTLSSSTSVFNSGSNNFMGVWHMNVSGTSARSDATGNAYNGTTNNYDGDEYTTGGIVGTADSLDGAASGDYMNVGAGMSDFSNGLTGELWVCPSDVSAWSHFFDFGSGGPSNNVFLSNSFDALQAQIYNGATGGGNITYSAAFTVGVWHHVVLTVSGTALKLYEDGALVATLTSSQSLAVGSRSNNYLGRSNWADPYFKGKMDEVRIQNATRSADWIKLDYEVQRVGQRTVQIGRRPNDFTNSVQFNFNTTNTGAGVGAVTNIPILVRLSSSNFTFSASNEGGTDLQFIDKDGTYLYHEVVEWDKAQQTGKVWVKVPQVDGNSTADYITLYYGCSTCLSNPYANTDSVFSMYRSVWHLNGPKAFGTGTVADVGVLKNDGTQIDNQAVGAGLVTESALQFNGTSDYITVTDDDYDFTTAVSVSAWIKVPSFGISNQAAVTKGNADWRLMRNGTNNTMGFTVNMSGSKTAVTTTSVNDGAWHMITGVFNGSTVRIFCDSVQEGSTAASGSLTSDNNQVWIGNNSGAATSFWNGAISEVRVANTVLSDDFIKLSHKNQKSADLLFATPITPTTASFQKSKVFKFNTTSTGAATTTDVYNFPVLIRITETTITDAVTTSGGKPLDIRFLDGDGKTWLDYDAERWTSGAADVWVKIPKVDGNSATDFFTMYYKQASGVTIRDGSCKACVFDTANGFQGVWHLHNADYTDATANGNNGTNTSTTVGTGIVAEGRTVASSQWVNVGGASTGSSLHATNAMTLGIWANASSKGANRKMMAKGFTSSASPSVEYDLQMDGSGVKYMFELTTGGSKTGVSTTTTPGTAAWYYVVGTYDGTTMRVYLNGLEEANTAKTGTVTDYAKALFLGGYEWAATQSFTGVIDEARVSNVCRSADWIKLEYANQRATPTLFQVSPSDFNYTKKFTFNTTVTGANVMNDVSDFPLLVRIVDADGGLLSKVKAGPTDIRFRDPDGTWLDYYVERWTTSTSPDSAEVWVKVPKIDGNSSTDYITMYYDDTTGTTIADGQCRTCVFPTATYRAIWPMNDASAVNNTITDIQGTYNGAFKRVAATRNTNLTTAAGIIGTGQVLDDASSDWIDLIATSGAILNSVGSATLSAWIKPTTISTNDRDYFFASTNASGTSSRFTARHTSTGFLKCGGRSADADALQEPIASSNALSTGTWYHVQMVVDYANDSTKIYLNGSPVTLANTGLSFSAATTGASNSLKAAIGSKSDGSGEYFGGSLDNFQLTTSVLSADYAKLSYETQRRDGAFFNVRPGPNNNVTLTATPGTNNIALSWNSAVSDSTNADSVGIWVKIKASGTAYSSTDYPDSVRTIAGGATLVVKLPISDTTYTYPATYPDLYYFALAVRNTNGKWSTFTAASEDTANYLLSPGYTDTIYVDSASGSDANTCTQARDPATPKVSIESAVACVTATAPGNAPNDTTVIRVFPGTYDGASNDLFDPPSTYPAEVVSFDNKSRAVLNSANTATSTVLLGGSMTLKNMNVKAATTGAYGVALKPSADEVLIIGCYIYNNGATTHGSGILIPDQACNGTLVANNVIVAPTLYGIDGGFDNKANIVHNVFYGSGATGTKGIYIHPAALGSASSNNITNNIFYNWDYGIQNADGAGVDGADGDVGNVSNNLYFLVTNGRAVVQETDAGAVYKDPLFYSTTIGNPNAFKLLPGSPAIDAGTATLTTVSGSYLTNATTYDAFGNARISGTAPDIGIYEGSGYTPNVTGEFNALSTSSTASTVTVQNSKWKLVWDKARDGGITQFYDLVTDPSAATNLVASNSLLFNVRIDGFTAQAGTSTTYAPSFVETSTARVVVRQRVGISASQDLNVYYTVYPSGHVYIMSELQNISTGTITVDAVNYTAKLGTAASVTISGGSLASNNYNNGFGYLINTSARDVLYSVTQDLDGNGAYAETWDQASFSGATDSIVFYTANLTDIPKNMKRQHHFMLYLGESSLDYQKASTLNADAYSPSVVTATTGSLLHQRSWQDNLIGHWPMDDGGGTSVRDKSLANTNNGTLTTASWTSGKVGSALKFTTSDVVSVADNNALEAGSNTTFMFWIKPDFTAMQSAAFILSKNNTTPQTDGWYFARSGSAITFNVGGTSIATPTLTDGVWTHIAGVISSTKVLYLYVNGVLVSASTASATTTANTSALRMGENGLSGSNGNFAGYLDDVRIYSTEVGMGDLQSIASVGFSQRSGHYHLRADNNNRVVALLNEASPATRFQPAFQIDNWYASKTPKYVYLNGTHLTPGTDYVVDTLTFTDATKGSFLILQLNKTLTGSSQTLFVDDDDSTGYLGTAGKMKTLTISATAGDKIAIQNFSDTVFGAASSQQWALELDLNGWTTNTIEGAGRQGFGNFNSWKAAAVSPNLSVSTAMELAGAEDKSGGALMNMKFEEGASTNTTRMWGGGVGYSSPATITPTIVDSSSTRLAFTLSPMTITNSPSGVKTLTLTKRYTVYPTGRIFCSWSITGMDLSLDAPTVNFQGRYNNALTASTFSDAQSRDSARAGRSGGNLDYHSYVGGMLSIKSNNVTTSTPASIVASHLGNNGSGTGADDYYRNRLLLVTTLFDATDDDVNPIVVNWFMDIAKDYVSSATADSMAQDLQHPATITAITGTANPSDALDFNTTAADGFAEGDGAYVYTATSGVAQFKFVNTFTAFSPVFRIKGWTVGTLPEFVIVDNQQLVKEYGYNIYLNTAASELVIQFNNTLTPGTHLFYISHTTGLAVTLNRFDAVSGQGVDTLKWTTQSEFENLGFNLYRRVKPGQGGDTSKTAIEARVEASGEGLAKTAVPAGAAAPAATRKVVPAGDSSGTPPSPSLSPQELVALGYVKITPKLIPGAPGGSSAATREYQFIDGTAGYDVTYEYLLEAVDFNGGRTLFGPREATPINPLETALYQNYPNPFNPITTLHFSLREKLRVSLVIFDTKGRVVRTLLRPDKPMAAGKYRLIWDARNDGGAEVPSGQYFYRFAVPHYLKTRKMILVK